MKVKVLRGTRASGKQLKPGDVANIADADAKILIRMGKVEKAAEKVAKSAEKKSAKSAKDK